MKKTIITLMAFFAFVAFNFAQISTPAPSPSAKLKQTVGLTDVTIEYSRPSMKGRTIMGDLVPYNEPWRTGANAATKVSFSKDVVVGGKEVKKGSYAMLTKPGMDKWEVMLFEYKSGNFGSYLKDDVTAAATFMAEAMKTDYKIESFMFAIDDLKNDAANIYMMWENTTVVMPIKVHTNKEVMASIDRTMAGPSKNDYFAAASYLHDTGHLEKAHDYILKATAGDDPKFWQVRRKALILADMGKKAEAISAAKKSMELAQKAGNKDYVRMNEKSIAKWGGKVDMKSKSMNEK